MIGIIAITDAILRKSGYFDADDRKRNQQQAEVLLSLIWTPRPRTETAHA